MDKEVVLWLSRHNPLPAQLEYLEKRLGKFKLVTYSNPVSTAEQAVQIALQNKAKYIIPVLPLSFIAHLVESAKKYNFTVLRAEMENIHSCSQYPCPEYNPQTDTIMQSRDFGTEKTVYRHFRFKEFRILKAIEIVSEPF